MLRIIRIYKETYAIIKKLMTFLGYNEEREPREFNTHRNKMKAKEVY